ncbi:TetR/AcrR family transcriptional regulator [Arthrobacter sp. 92]|uniref:TetR/AcrR family transcriptional regulator n=1 Tax=Arthrobacter sp. 92 TaxID=3418175 RepID=UPI003CFF05ED
MKRRRRIVEAAARIFGQYGYHRGSLRQIAQDIGVIAPTMVSHFGHKEALLMAVRDNWNAQSGIVSGDHAALAYFQRLPRLMEDHTAHRGLLNCF